MLFLGFPQIYSVILREHTIAYNASNFAVRK